MDTKHSGTQTAATATTTASPPSPSRPWREPTPADLEETRKRAPDLVEREALLVLRGERPPLAEKPKDAPEPEHPIVFDEPGDPRKALEKAAIWELHLRGYSVDKMGLKLKMGRGKVGRLLDEVKQDMVQWMADHPTAFASPMELVFEQVQRRRDRQAAMWDELANCELASVKPQFYRLIAEEDRDIERLVGLDKSTIEVLFGSPMESAQAELLRKAGPEGLGQILKALRDLHVEVSGQEIKTTSSVVVEGSIRELREDGGEHGPTHSPNPQARPVRPALPKPKKKQPWFQNLESDSD